MLLQDMSMKEAVAFIGHYPRCNIVALEYPVNGLANEHSELTFREKIDTLLSVTSKVFIVFRVCINIFPYHYP